MHLQALGTGLTISRDAIRPHPRKSWNLRPHLALDLFLIPLMVRDQGCSTERPHGLAEAGCGRGWGFLIPLMVRDQGCSTERPLGLSEAGCGRAWGCATACAAAAQPPSSSAWQGAPTCLNVSYQLLLVWAPEKAVGERRLSLPTLPMEDWQRVVGAGPPPWNAFHGT